jgi:mono/diheme cytochrome c family protein
VRRALASVVLTLAAPVALLAADKAIRLPPDNPSGQLRPGPGVEAALNNCLTCHSTDYIVRQPRGDAAQWQAVVTKMIAVFGAPISEQDARAIVEYLASTYGPTR